jgi:hypothetical protein
MHLNRITFAAGLAIGFVAGTRAGRERYDQMVKMAKTARENPKFQQAASTAQSQATDLLNSAGKKVAEGAPRLAHSAMHTVGGHVPMLRHHGGDGQAPSNGKDEAASERPFAATSNSHHRSSNK